MKRSLRVAAVIVALVVVTMSPSVVGAAGPSFRAPLSGAQEVPQRDTPARGQAIFVQGDGALRYWLVVSSISNVVAAHIHCGSTGVNGPVGVTLFMGTISGSFSGLLASGSITAPDPGNTCGWSDLGAVLDAMQSGDTYVNVHTNDGVDPANTGPGDFPGGEIRGQIG